MNTTEAERDYPREWAEIEAGMAELAGNDQIVAPVYAKVQQDHLVVLAAHVTLEPSSEEATRVRLSVDTRYVRLAARIWPKPRAVA